MDLEEELLREEALLQEEELLQEEAFNKKIHLNGIKYILIGAAALLLLCVIAVFPKSEARYESWTVEARIVEKMITEMDGETVYLLRTEDRNGQEALYELHQKSVSKTLGAEKAYQELKDGKVYQFRVMPKEVYKSHYPAIRGAVSCPGGFSEETTQATKEQN